MFGKKRPKAQLHTYRNRGRFEVTVGGKRQMASSAMQAQKLVREAKAAGKSAVFREV